MKSSPIFKLIAAVALSELAGVIGALFTTPAIGTWYATLARPDFSPPSFVFAPVWTTLYALMGIAAFLVWQKRDAAPLARRNAVILFFIQLVLNTLWSILFFGLHNPGLAFAEIALLWLAIAATINAFARVSRTAAWLLAPYLLWVTFASYLNYAIWTLNS
ncbi:MAG TPA: TspO/MBR family protein [Candidatus Paceibacterota bacterium]|nr:TspO/MBR family protein [Candidatus Paceibacterota bacterium]